MKKQRMRNIFLCLTSTSQDEILWVKNKMDVALNDVSRKYTQFEMQEFADSIQKIIIIAKRI